MSVPYVGTSGAIVTPVEEISAKLYSFECLRPAPEKHTLCITNATQVSTRNAAKIRKSPTCISATTREAPGEWYGEERFRVAPQTRPRHI